MRQLLAKLASQEWLAEIVGSIKRVTDIVGEITAASTEQSAGVTQVGEAVSQMDTVTQQNAALVEQSAAAAESLRIQAEQLVRSVAVFRIENAVATTARVPTIPAVVPDHHASEMPSDTRRAKATVIAASGQTDAENWQAF